MTASDINTLIGSTKQALDRRVILGVPISNETHVLFNSLIKDLEYCEKQYLATGEDIYKNKITILEDKIYTLKVKCPSICYYPTFNFGGEVIDFKTSNMKIQIDTLKYKISQLQIIY